MFISVFNVIERTVIMVGNDWGTVSIFYIFKSFLRCDMQKTLRNLFFIIFLKKRLGVLQILYQEPDYTFLKVYDVLKQDLISEIHRISGFRDVPTEICREHVFGNI